MLSFADNLLTRVLCWAGVTAALLVLVAVVVPSAGASTATPAWSVQSIASPTNFIPGDESGDEAYKVYVTNVGAEATDSSQITITDTLPPGVTAVPGFKGVSVEGNSYNPREGLSCSTAPAQCTYTGAVPAGDILEMDIWVAIAPSASGSITNRVSVTGGGARSASVAAENSVSAAPAPFAIKDFGFGAGGLDGLPETQAGAHPYALTTSFDLNTEQVPVEPTLSLPSQSVKDVVVDLPLGFAGDALAAPRCPLADLEETTYNAYMCPADTRIGDVTLHSSLNGVSSSVVGIGNSFGAPVSPVYNIEPEHGYPAEFGFNVVNVANVHLFASVARTEAGYVLRVTDPDVPSELLAGMESFLAGVTLTLYGDPGSRNGEGRSLPFFTNPVDCSGGSPTTVLHTDTWTNKGRVNPDGTPDFSDPNWLSATSTMPPVIGCDALQFQPTVAVAPESVQADSPTGVTVDVRVPQAPENDFALATPALRDVSVALPAGVAVSPGAADGLQGCGEAQIALSSTQPGTCPQASQVGTVEAVTPILPEPLQGRVYIASPKCGGEGQPGCTEASATNGELYGLYVEVQGPGFALKFPAAVAADPVSGRLTATFKDLAEQPVSDIKLRLKGGPRAPLATPQACGAAVTRSDLTPWSAPETPDAVLSSSFNVDWDGQGGACPAGLPFAPAFSAGTSTPTAGGFSPFTLTFSRQDREQDLSGASVTLPPGLLGALKSVPLCGEPQAAQGACGAQSLVGHTTVAAGAGSHPFYVSGQVFLTGPYHGAPFGLSIVVPADAGPFHLGNVIVRAAIHVDMHTSQAIVTSDAFPQMIDGVPLRVKTVNVTIDRPGFIFNPTNCSRQQVTGTITAAQGASASVSSPFAVADCANLRFKPMFTVSTQAATSKKNGASLDVKTGYAAGSANIRSVAVTLPVQLPARLSTIQQACPQATFDANPAGCPAGSVIGIGTASTPILASALIGPAFLVSHGGAAFPDLVLILQGEGVTVQLTGSINIKKNITSSTFASVPDAPISSFELKLPEGPHSGLAAVLPAKAKGNLCGSSLTMPTTITAQSGAVVRQTTKIKVTGCPRARKKPKVKRARAAHGARRPTSGLTRRRRS